jgi:pyridoxal phosphate enzyme (YggS family)
MHDSYKNLLSIQSEIKKEFDNINNKSINPEIIAVSKTFPIEHIKPIIEQGHIHFGENKVQEAEKKWEEEKNKNPHIKLHFIGKLQSNKVKSALKVFDYIHSVDSYKLAETIAKQEDSLRKKIKLFVQINIGEEPQKSGIKISETEKFVKKCKEEMSLNIIGLMCLPPINKDSVEFFLKMKNLKKKLNIPHLSMGMTSDYLKAVQYESTFLRIGTKIFGARS